MPRNIVALIWVGGLVLAAIVYLVGPDRFVFGMFDALQEVWWRLQEALRNISIAAFDLVRALAIGLYFVFAVLAVLSMRRGGRGTGALIAVTVVFFGLIWQSAGQGFGAHSRWLAALLLSAVAALAMTRRLTAPEIPPWRAGSVPPHHAP